MKLNEFHVGKNGAGTGGERQPLADGSKRVGGLAIEPAEASGRDHEAGGRQEQRSRRPDCQHAGDAAIMHKETTGLDSLEHRNRCRSTDGSDEGAHDLASGGITAGMKDTSATVRSLETDVEGAAGIAIEDDTVAKERGDGIVSGAGNAFDCAPIAQTVARRDRIGGVEGRRVIVPECGGDTALSPNARRA
jgi:hypothetical protein